MAITGYMESSLVHSEVFNGDGSGSSGINHMDKSRTTLDKAIDLIKTAKHLTNEDIEAAYIAVKQISDSLTRAAMKAFDEERVVLIYNNVQSLSLTQAIPFITLKTKRGFVTYVFVDKYIQVSRDGVLSMQAPVLRDLLTGALIANGLKNNYANLARNQYLQKILMEIYTKFFTRIINRQFSVAADKITFDTIQYWINRFFLENIFESNDTAENINTISKAHIKYLDEMRANEIVHEYDNANPHKVSELIDLLKTASPRMRSAHLGTLLNDWINYYYIPSTLAVDNIEYLIFMCITLLAGNNIINISASDVVKETKNIKSFRGELLKLI